MQLLPEAALASDFEVRPRWHGFDVLTPTAVGKRNYGTFGYTSSSIAVAVFGCSSTTIGSFDAFSKCTIPSFLPVWVHLRKSMNINYLAKIALRPIVAYRADGANAE